MAEPESGAFGFPRPGEVLRRLRTQRGLSLREVAEASGLSSSFLASLERGETDIALERLARLARVFGHDVGSFLGFSQPRTKPRFLGEDERVVVDRGLGVRYVAYPLADMGIEVVVLDFAPRTAFRGAMAHEGADVTVITRGQIVVAYAGEEHLMRAGDVVTWPGGHPHAFRNDTDAPAQCVGVVTTMLY
jgi:transcriptional regulator with XRE-family HTH domain